MSTNNTIIAISREFMSGGHAIGKLLAKALGYNFYDKEILAMASESSGIKPEIMESMDEKPASSFLYSVAMNFLSPDQIHPWYSDVPMDQQVYQAQADAVRKAAEEGPCVIVGRSAGYILDDCPNLINIFIHAPVEDRIKKLMTEDKVSYNKAKESVTKTDKRRANYYNTYTGKKWGEPDDYDLCLNTSKLDDETAVALLKDFVEKLKKA